MTKFIEFSMQIFLALPDLTSYSRRESSVWNSMLKKAQVIDMTMKSRVKKPSPKNVAVCLIQRGAKPTADDLDKTKWQ